MLMPIEEEIPYLYLDHQACKHEKCRTDSLDEELEVSDLLSLVTKPDAEYLRSYRSLRRNSTYNNPKNRSTRTRFLTLTGGINSRSHLSPKEFHTDSPSAMSNYLRFPSSTNSGDKQLQRDGRAPEWVSSLLPSEVSPLVQHFGRLLRTRKQFCHSFRESHSASQKSTGDADVPNNGSV